MSTINDPYPTYRELLENHPVSWHDQMKCWVVVRYADCREVLRNHEVYARDWRRVGDEIPEFKQSVQSQDPPDQGVLRSFLMNRIKEQDLADICRRGCSRVARRLDALRGTGPFGLRRSVRSPRRRGRSLSSGHRRSAGSRTRSSPTPRRWRLN
ncbi:hypothetical protein [Micromonospora wenchangensis]|uniref:hypothetical protein n=1 Tax=Micromonospora wenchangensis TaxID=1185415 RepID=UPI003D75A40F